MKTNPKRNINNALNNKPEINNDLFLLAKLKKDQEELQRKNDSLAQENKKMIDEQRKKIQ